MCFIDELNLPFERLVSCSFLISDIFIPEKVANIVLDLRVIAWSVVVPNDLICCLFNNK